MITRIEIDGFKSFSNFAVDLKPFQVLIGPNGVGKSNLFDAIVLLTHLAGDGTLYDAFRKNRGEVGELFTLLPDGNRTATMRFAVEMLIDKRVSDSLGVEDEVSSTRLRYELEIERRTEQGFERLYVKRESLRAIIEDDDRWFKVNIPAKNRKYWIVRGRRAPYISTDNQRIYKHQDGRRGGKQETHLGRVERTILSTINSVEYPTAYAAREEMLSWQFLQLDPGKLHTPSGVYAPTNLLPDGSNLAAVLHRMSREDEFALDDVSLDMANVVPGILKVSVKALVEREEFLIEAQTQDGPKFSSRVLSDGTLRLLALITLKNDPHYRGVLCFEEPENGVHPSRLERIVNVLKQLATDFHTEPGEDDTAPKQVLVNTHSPKLTSCVEPETLLFIYMAGHTPRSTRVATVGLTEEMFPPEDMQKKYFTLAQVREFLDPSSLTHSLDEIQQLEQAL